MVENYFEKMYIVLKWSFHSFNFHSIVCRQVSGIVNIRQSTETCLNYPQLVLDRFVSLLLFHVMPPINFETFWQSSAPLAFSARACTVSIAGHVCIRQCHIVAPNKLLYPNGSSSEQPSQKSGCAVVNFFAVVRWENTSKERRDSTAMS